MPAESAQLHRAAATVPPGPWAVGVSGGADSVALLLILRWRADLHVHVVHLNHETRGVESEGDAEFVKRLCADSNLPCTVARRSEIEPQLPSLPNNPSSRYRVLRLELFARVIAERSLQGVILAHHANDVAETTLQRLLRGSGFEGLGALRRENVVRGVRTLRPLIDVRAETLKQYLRSSQQEWREDASNQSDDYFRNRLRKVLAQRPELIGAMLQLGRACGALQDWTRDAAPALDERFAMSQLADLPSILAREAGRRWLVERGVDPGAVTQDVLARLLEMSADAASPGRQTFPGGLCVRRTRGQMYAEATEVAISSQKMAGLRGCNALPKMA